MTYPWCDHIDHDAFDELDLSSGGSKSGAVGCMARRLADLDRRERQLVTELEHIQEAKATALAAMDRFIAQGHPAQLVQPPLPSQSRHSP